MAANRHAVHSMIWKANSADCRQEVRTDTVCLKRVQCAAGHSSGSRAPQHSRVRARLGSPLLPHANLRARVELAVAVEEAEQQPAGVEDGRNGCCASRRWVRDGGLEREVPHQARAEQTGELRGTSSKLVHATAAGDLTPASLWHQSWVLAPQTGGRPWCAGWSRTGQCPAGRAGTAG